MSTLELKNLEKSYHGRRVVDSVSIEVNSSDVVGLLGPNGAGKTTTFYMAVGMIKADRGNKTFAPFTTKCGLFRRR